MYIGIKESTTRMMLQKNLEKLGIEEGDGLVLFGGAFIIAFMVASCLADVQHLEDRERRAAPWQWDR